MLDWLFQRTPAAHKLEDDPTDPLAPLPARGFRRQADRLCFKVAPEELEQARTQEFFRRLEARVHSGELTLPLLADSAGEVLALCSDPRSDGLQIANVLLRDPAMAAHVLRVANSSLLAPSARITSLNQAVARLGLSQVKEIAIGVLLRERILTAPGHEREARMMWDHAALSAGFSRLIAQRVGADVEEVVLCALLHDIGGPVLFQAAHDLQRSMTEQVDPAVVRAACWAFHALVGAELARRWRLPDSVVRIIASYREREPKDERRRGAQIVGLADLLAGWALDPWAAPNNAPGSDDPRRAALSIGDGDWAAIVAQLPQVRLAARAYSE